MDSGKFVYIKIAVWVCFCYENGFSLVLEQIHKLLELKIFNNDLGTPKSADLPNLSQKIFPIFGSKRW